MAPATNTTITATPSESYSYQTDALGSTRLLSDGNGAVADDVAFDAWGVQLAGGDVVKNQYLYTGEQFDENLEQTYLRARYLSSKTGRFQKMDTWPGEQNMPVTFNKYIYANVDAVNTLDPTGQFGISGLVSGFSAAGRMGGAVFRLPTLLARGAGAGSRGATALLRGSLNYLKRVAAKCKIRNKKPSLCGYARGSLEAELKITLLLARTPNAKKDGVNPRRVIVGAFDSARGRGTSAFNGFAKAAGGVATRLRKLGYKVGDLHSCGTTVGRCAEFRSAHKLIRSGSKINHIHWTLAYQVEKGEHGFLERGGLRKYCGTCRETFGVSNK